MNEQNVWLNRYHRETMMFYKNSEKGVITENVNDGKQKPPQKLKKNTGGINIAILNLMK